MAYERCIEVSSELWEDLAKLDPLEVSRRTGAVWADNRFHLPFLGRELLIDPARQLVQVIGSAGEEPAFRVCLTALLYLLRMEPAALGPPISPMELPGGATFFRGHHSLPNAPLEVRFGRDLPGFLAAGRKLKGETRPAGDAALAFEVFPSLTVEVILWQADDEFPAQVSFTVPAHLDRFWFLDAVLGLLGMVTDELRRAAAG